MAMVNRKPTERDQLVLVLCDLCGAEARLCEHLQAAYADAKRIRSYAVAANRLAERLELVSAQTGTQKPRVA